MARIKGLLTTKLALLEQIPVVLRVTRMICLTLIRAYAAQIKHDSTSEVQRTGHSEVRMVDNPPHLYNMNCTITALTTFTYAALTRMRVCFLKHDNVFRKERALVLFK
jgi:hypothetical protein